MGMLNQSCFSFMMWGIVAVYCMKVKGISISSGPRDLVVREGSRVVMECTVERQGRDVVQWYHVSADDLNPISRNRDIEAGASPVDGRYEITGNHRDGEYDLNIVNANRGDSGEYRCGFETGGRAGGITSEGAELEVVVPPDEVSPLCIMTPDDRSISSSTPGFLSVGDVVRMSCVSVGGVPPAELIWKRGITTMTPVTSGTAAFVRVIETSDLDEEFTCYAMSIALDAPRSCSLTPARRPPDVQIMPRSVTVPPQGGVTFACEADGAVPPRSDYTWLLNGDEILNDGRERFQVSRDTRSLTVSGIRTSDHGAVIRCELHSPAGFLGQAEATLTVTGVRDTSEVPTTAITSTTESSLSISSSSPVSSSMVTLEATEPSGNGTNNQPQGMSGELIAVSAVAGIAIGILGVILVLFIFKRHRKRQAKRANRRQNAGSPHQQPGNKPALAVQPMQQGNAYSAQLSEDGYTILKKTSKNKAVSAMSTNSGVYEVVGDDVRPTAPKQDPADNGLYWDYEIPYSDDHTKRQGMTATNPIYLEVIE